MAHIYVEDSPAAEPQFNYPIIAKALSPLLSRKSDGAVVLGVHGSWGSGKTTLLHEIQRELRTQFDDAHGIFIDFNAWKYQDRQSLWRALVLRVIGALSDRGADAAQLEELRASLYRSFSVEEKGPWKVNWKSVIVEAASMLLSLMRLSFVATALRATGGFFSTLFLGGKEAKKDDDGALVDSDRIEKFAAVLERTAVERQVVQVESIEQFLEKFAGLLAPLAADGKRLFVFIDDLDRCLPESALEIFEAIKLFLDAPGCAYVVALDRDVIRKGLAVKYSQQEKNGASAFINPDEYIEKTISVSYDLPRLSQADARGILRDFELPFALSEYHENLILLVLGTNPRRLKRFMNSLSIQLQLARLANAAKAPIDAALLSLPDDGSATRFSYFLKLALLGYRYSALLSIVQSDPRLLDRLQQLSNGYVENAKKDPAAARTARNESLAAESILLGGLKEDEEFWQMMAATPSFIDDFALTTRYLGWFRHGAAGGKAGG